MKQSLDRAKSCLETLMGSITSQKCQKNKSHSFNSYTNFICLHPSCDRRMICSKCIVEDKGHTQGHKAFIMTLKEFEKVAYDRCIDSFAVDINLVREEIGTKFKEKVAKCADLCQRSVKESFDVDFPLKITEINDTYDEVIDAPVGMFAGKSQERVKAICENFAGKRKNGSGYKKSIDKNLEDLIKFVTKKSNEEKILWESAGKILQRQKHRILYNKKLEENLEADVRSLTKKYISDVMEVYKSYFFESDFDGISKIDDEIPGSDVASCLSLDLSRGEERTEYHDKSTQVNFGKQISTRYLGQSKNLKTIKKKYIISEIGNKSNERVKPDVENEFRISMKRMETEEDTKEEEHEMSNLIDISHFSYISPLSNDVTQDESRVLDNGGGVFSAKKTLEPDIIESFKELQGNLEIQSPVVYKNRRQVDRASAFYCWLPNDASKFCQMFVDDFKFFTIMDVAKAKDISNFMQAFYELYYPDLFYIFLEYQSTSMTYPGLSWMVVNNLMTLCGFKNELFTQAICDQIFRDVTETVVFILDKDQSKSESMDNCLLRSGFMSFLARSALFRYYISGECKDPVQALHKFMDRFLKYAKSSWEEYETKRNTLIHTEEVDKTVQFFIEEVKEVYEEIARSDGYLRLKDLISWIDSTELIMNENEVQRCFIFSKMPIINEYQVAIKDYFCMEFVEFLEFLVRISEIDFYNEEELELFQKVQRTFQKIFSLF